MLATTTLFAIAVLAFRLTTPLPPLKVSGYTQLTNDGRAKLWPGVSGKMVTDGARVYYVESPGVSPKLTQVSAAGGETSAIPTPFEVSRIGDISPDRAALLISILAAEDEPPVWVLPLPAGTPHRLGDLVGHDETWSPDGRRILFANGNDLYVAGADRGRIQKVCVLPILYCPTGTILRRSAVGAGRRMGSTSSLSRSWR